MTDFETMPVGTAALLRSLANLMRAEHLEEVKLYEEADEKLRCANGRSQEEIFGHERMLAEFRVNRLAERIGAIEALLDRSHAAAATG